MESKSKTIMHLPKCNIDIILKNISVDTDNEDMLNIEYDYDDDTVSKEDIDKEVGDIIIEALRNNIREDDIEDLPV